MLWVNVQKVNCGRTEADNQVCDAALDYSWIKGGLRAAERTMLDISWAQMMWALIVGGRRASWVKQLRDSDRMAADNDTAVIMRLL